MNKYAKNIIAALIVAVLGGKVCEAKFEVAEKDMKGLFEVKYIEENPVPQVTEAMKSNGYVPFTRNPCKKIFPNTIPAKEDITDKILLTSAPGQYEAALLGIYPLQDLNGVKVTAGNLVNKEGNSKISNNNIDIRIIKALTRRIGDERNSTFMVLPTVLERVDSFDINKGKTRAYWITVKIPDDVKAGEYSGDITINPAGGGKSCKIAFTVTVLPFKIVSSPNVSYSMLYVYNDLLGIDKKSGADKEKQLNTARIMYRDMQEHGMNTLSPHHGKYEEKNGKHYNAALEEASKLAKEMGFKYPVIHVQSVVPVAKDKYSFNYLEFKESKHLPLLKEYVAYYEDKVRKEGWPGIIWIPLDEPEDKVRRDLGGKVLKVIKSVPGTVTCVTGGKLKDVEQYFPLADIIVIWHWKKEDLSKFKELKKQNKKVWWYPNGTVSPLDEGNGMATFSRFCFGFGVWAYELDGVTPWTYPLQPEVFPRNVRIVDGVDKINVKDGFLGSDGKPIPIIQWEACRIGITDARYLYKLESLIKENKDSGKASLKTACTKGADLLTEVRSKVLSIDPDKMTNEIKWAEPISGNDEIGRNGNWTPDMIEEAKSRVIKAILEIEKSK